MFKRSLGWMMRLAAAVVMLAGGGAGGCAAQPTQYHVYIGTYTDAKTKGIYVADFDSATGKLGEPRLAAELKQPSFLEIHPNGKHLLAVGETPDFNGQKSGSISSFAITGAGGELTLINQQTTGGTAPCHISLDPKGRYAFIANYGGGSVAAYPVQKDGRLLPSSGFVQHMGSSVLPRQAQPHAHSIKMDPTKKFVMAADLGLDKLLIYKLGTAGELVPHDPAFAKLAPGAGPRHFAFHTSGKYCYVLNEIQSTVTVFAYDGTKGSFSELQSITTLPKDFKGNSSTAEIVVHPTGKFVYASNRGHDSIAVFGVDSQTGKLTHMGNTPSGGKTPRNFNVDPSGRWLLAGNQSTHNIAVFSINPDTGELTATGQSVSVGSPVCIRFLAVK